MKISLRLYQLEQAAQKQAVTQELDRYQAGRAVCAEYILSTMAEEHADYIRLKLAEVETEMEDGEPLDDPLVSAYLSLTSFMYSELLRNVEPRVYALPPALARMYLARKSAPRAQLPLIHCDCAECGLLHPCWLPSRSEMPPCVLCGGRVGLSAWHSNGHGRPLTENKP